MACRYGFNPGSTECFYGCMPTASLVAVNTTLAASAGGVGVLVIQTVILGQAPDIGDFMNGILTGTRSRWWLSVLLKWKHEQGHDSGLRGRRCRQGTGKRN